MGVFDVYKISKILKIWNGSKFDMEMSFLIFWSFCFL